MGGRERGRFATSRGWRKKVEKRVTAMSTEKEDSRSWRGCSQIRRRDEKSTAGVGAPSIKRNIYTPEEFIKIGNIRRRGDRPVQTDEWGATTCRRCGCAVSGFFHSLYLIHVRQVRNGCIITSFFWIIIMMHNLVFSLIVLGGCWTDYKPY